MLNLFNNFYLLPANMGYYEKTHNFFCAVMPDESLSGFSMGNLPKAKCLAQGKDLDECFATVTPEDAINSADTITLLYADGPSYHTFLCRFLKTIFPSIDDSNADKFIKFIGSSVKMISYNSYMLSLKGCDIPYSVEELYTDYFCRPVDMSVVKPFNIELSKLGLDWLLYDTLSGPNQFPSELEIAVKKAYTAALENEINGVLGLNQYYGISTDAEDLKTLAIQVGKLDISNGVDLCKDVAKKGTLRTVKQLLDNLKTSGDVSFFPHRCEYDRSNTFIVWLAINSQKNGFSVPTIGA